VNEVRQIQHGPMRMIIIHQGLRYAFNWNPWWSTGVFLCADPAASVSFIRELKPGVQ
jgi:hypothetical protein